MNNEFKQISKGDITRYVLESGSSGGTSSGSVASVSMPMGGTRKRGDNLITQEADKKTVPSSTPRNFVAKNAKSSGAGAHKDKKKAAKQGQEKHKKPFMEDHSTATGGWGQGSYDTYSAGNHGRGVAENERDHPDHEIQMASSELMSIAKNAESLLDMVRRYSEQEGLDAWQQSKITKAADYLNSVLQSINGEQQGVAEGVSLKQRHEDKKRADQNQVRYGKMTQAEFDKKWSRTERPTPTSKEQGVAEGKEDKIAQLKKDHATAVHWSKNETSPQKREAARQKAEKIKSHLEKQYKQGVAEAIVSSGDATLELLELNLFKDLIGEHSLSNYDEEFAQSPEWQKVVARWAPKAEGLYNAVIILHNAGKKISSQEARAITDTAYDGSDAYNDPVSAASDLPRIYAQQYNAISQFIQNISNSKPNNIHEQGVSEEIDTEELANEVYAEFERIYPNLARRADERTVHAAIMDVLNYGGDSDPSALAQDVARAVKQEMQQGVAEGVAETVSMDQAKKVLRHYGADHFKTTTNELHFYKNGRPFSVDLIFNNDATRSVSLSSLNSATRGLKGQGVAEDFSKELRDKLDSERLKIANPEKYQHQQQINQQDREHELNIGSQGRAKSKQKADELAEIKREKLRRERLEDEELANQRYTKRAEREQEMEKIRLQYNHELKLINTEHSNNMEAIKTGNSHELTKMDKEYAEADRERRHAAGESDKDRAERAREREANRQEPTDKPEDDYYDIPPGANFNPNTDKPLRPQNSQQWHTSQQLQYKNDDVIDVDAKPLPNQPLRLKEKLSVVKDPAHATGIQQTGGITHGSVYIPGKSQIQKPRWQTREIPVLKHEIAVDANGRTQKQWIELVKDKYPDARVIGSKMINGPVRALLPNGKTIHWEKAEQNIAEGDTYFESLQSMMERQLEPNMDLDTWIDNFQHADPNKYHQFKHKTPEKKK